MALKPWKQRSSIQIKRLIRSLLIRYAEAIDLTGPIWQAGYDDFVLFTGRKVEEKLADMHQNPMRAGLVGSPEDGPWRWAGYDEACRSVGAPVGWLG